MTQIHTEPHPRAGKTVVLNEHATDPHRGMFEPGTHYEVEDYWDRLTGKGWGESNGNPAALMYAFRQGMKAIENGGTPPLDDEVVYGKIGNIGHLVHVSELGEVVAQKADEDEDVA